MQLRELAISELKSVSNWLKANRLSANHSKTHFMIFKGLRKLDFSLRILFDGKTISQKDSSKMMGVIIDEKLNWSEHIGKVRAKVSRAIGILHKFSKILPSDTLKLIYYSILQPHLQYCNVWWGNAPKSLILPLFRLQKKATRKVCQASFFEHTNYLFKSKKILKLQDINTLESIKFVQKEINKPNSTYFIRRERPLNMVLRNANPQSLYLPQPRSEREKRFISYHAPKVWNALPEQLQNQRNPVTFKNNIKKKLLDQY